MIDGSQRPILNARGHLTDTHTSNLVQIIAVGLPSYLPQLTQARASSPRTPTNDNQYLIEDVSNCRLVRAHPSTIQERLGDARLASFFVGTATKHLIQVPDGPLILNPGSVGCSSYDDPGNDPHVSEGARRTRDMRCSRLTSIRCPQT